MDPTTGVPALDALLQGPRRGENVVWRVDSPAAYAELVRPFCRVARERGTPLVYFRFAKHPELVEAEAGIERVELDPSRGFERFLTEVHHTILGATAGTHFVFDLFTDVLSDWFSERMAGNFFLLTCPLLVTAGAVTYFGLVRNRHSFHVVRPMVESTQVLVDLYWHEGRFYLHPQKVADRHSRTMYLLHSWDGERLETVVDSATTCEVIQSSPWPGLRSASYRMIGMWDRRFLRAEELLAAHQRGDVSAEALQQVFDHLVRQVLAQDERMLDLVTRYLTLPDLISVWKHVIGSGRIGGKAVGLLLARAILARTDPKWEHLLEPHDSFFIGSDVFYSYLVDNGCWWIREKQRHPETLLEGLEEARARILEGRFPDYLLARFSDMLDYFGQAPIIVRSSSLLEDAFGNAYAGKYESVFCTNQGSRMERLQQFLDAIRAVYASALSESALLYRAKCGALDRDEQMALLIQRVSGAEYGGLFFPQLAGVGFSYNPFVWDPGIDPEAGVLRLVFGLGTRAVDRRDDDYTRIVALNAPLKRPEGSREEAEQHTQRQVDCLDLDRGGLVSLYFGDLVERSPGLATERFARRAPVWTDQPANRASSSLDLDRVIEETPLVNQVREALAILSHAYGCPIDVEFTANVRPDGEFRLNVLQCRPLHVTVRHETVTLLGEVAPEELLLRVDGAVLGSSRRLVVDRLVYVVPPLYSALPKHLKHEVARVIREVMHAGPEPGAGRTMLIGPGRWGTTMPELGVPVRFRDIDTARVICELDMMHAGLSPDLSLGTHFFHELVELDLLYLGLPSRRPGNLLNTHLLASLPNRLNLLVPDAVALHDTIRVLDAPPGKQMVLTADHPTQRAVLVLEDASGEAADPRRGGPT